MRATHDRTDSDYSQTGPPRRPAYIPVNVANGHPPSLPAQPQVHSLPPRPSSAIASTQVPGTSPNIPSRLRASSVASAASSVSQDSRSMDARTPTPSFSVGTTASSQTSQGTSLNTAPNGNTQGPPKPGLPVPGGNGQLYGTKPLAYPTGEQVPGVFSAVTF